MGKEKQYRELAESIEDVFFAMDKNLRYTYWNKASEKLTGIKAKDAIGKSIFKIFSDREDTRRAVAVYRKVLQTQQPQTFVNEYQLRGKDYFFEISAYPSTGGLSVFVKDITKRKKAEEELRESQAKFWGLFTNNPGAAVYMDPDFHILDVNQRFEELFGYSFDEIKGKHIDDVVVQEDKMEEAMMMGRKASEGYIQLDTVRKRKDGTLVPVALFAAPVIVEDQLIGSVGLYMDMTERKRAEEETRNLAKFPSENPDPVMRIAKDGTILYANAAAQSLLREWKCKLGGLAPDKWRRLVANVHSSGLKQELEIKHRDQVFFFVLAPVTDAAYVNIYGRDITERKKMEEEMRARDRVLAASISRAREMEMKNKFISAITHELRTPLISIKGYIDYILSGKLEPLPEKTESSLEVVKRNTERLLNLTDNLLDIRRIESGRLQLDLKPMKFREVIDHCATEVQPSLKEKKQSFHLEVPKGALMIQGDRVRLSQVVMNLLNNASKFTPEKGDITLRVVEEEDMIRVQVSDTGIGIEKEDLERVFQPFASIKKPEYFKGTGIGLNVSKGLVEAHEGRIWAESPGEGRGATFTFTLPKRKREEVS